METIFWPILKKNTKDCDLKMNLELLISQHYSIETMDEFKGSIIQVDALRRAAFFKTKNPVTKNEHLSLLTNYYLQLVDLDAIYLNCKAGFTQKFTWYHSFEKSSIAGKFRKAESKELNFEMGNVLFNLIAEICNQSQSIDFESTDDLNNAQRDFVIASGGFQYLATYSNSHNLHHLLDDLLPYLLNIYSILCLSHAHEIIFLKSIRAKKPNALTAAIASQIQLLYGQCMSNVKSLKTTQAYIKELQKFLDAKLTLFKGFTHYYQGLVESENAKKTEHYSRFTAAKELLLKLDMINGLKFKLYKDMVAGVRAEINDVIDEHQKFEIEKPLPADSLPQVPPQRILEAKKFAVDEVTRYLTHTEYCNAFEGLNSLSVINMTHFFELTKRNFILIHENEIHKHKKTMEKEFLAMDVPYRFENCSEGFPPSVTKCIEEYRQYGGFAVLQNNIDQVTEIQNFNVDMIESMRNDMRRAKEINRHLVHKYHQIHDQIDMTEQISQHNSSVSYYFGKLEQTHNTDERLMNNFQRSVSGFEFLNKPESEMIMGINTEKDLEIVKTDETRELKMLNELYDQCCELHQERCAIRDEMSQHNDFKDEIKYILREFPTELHSFKAEEAIKEAFEPLIGKLASTYQKQDETIELMKNTVASLSHLKGVSERTIDLFKHITKYYNDFKEISAHIESSLKWHENFRATVLNVQESNNSFLKAYQFQMTELIGPDVNKYFYMNEDSLLAMSSKPPSTPSFDNIHGKPPPTTGFDNVQPGFENMQTLASSDITNTPTNSTTGNYPPATGPQMQPLPPTAVSSSSSMVMNSGMPANRPLPPTQSTYSNQPTYSNYPNSNHPISGSGGYRNSSVATSVPPSQMSNYPYYPADANSRPPAFNNNRMGAGHGYANAKMQGDYNGPNKMTGDVPPSSMHGYKMPGDVPPPGSAANRMKKTADLLHSPPTEFRGHHPLPPPTNGRGYPPPQTAAAHNYQNYPPSAADHSAHASKKTSKIYDGQTDSMTHHPTSMPPYPSSGVQKPPYNMDYKQPPPSTNMPNNYNPTLYPANSSNNYNSSYNGNFPNQNYYPPPNANSNSRAGPPHPPYANQPPQGYSNNGGSGGYPVYTNSNYPSYPPSSVPPTGPYPPYANMQAGYHYPPPPQSAHIGSNQHQYSLPPSTQYGNKYVPR